MKLGATLEGNLAAFVGSCLLGGAVVATRAAVDDIDPLNLAFLRYFLGGVCLAAVVSISRPGALRLPRSAWPGIVGLGMLMYALFPVLFNTSLRYTTASRGAVILALMPLFTAILGALSRSERLRMLQWLGVGVSIGGVAVVFAESGLGFAGGGSVALGNTLMVATALTGAIYSVRVRPWLRRYGALPVTSMAMLSGAALLLLPALVGGVVHEVREAPTSANLLVLYLGIPGGALAFVLANMGLSRLSATQAILYINLNPVIATVLGALLLGESLTRWFGLGFLLVITGLLMANVPKRSGQQAAAGNPPG